MATNRFVYLIALLGALCFYVAASPVWFSWILLFLVLVLPLLSLLLSLPQMLSVRLEAEASERVELGERLVLQLSPFPSRWLPMPELRLRLKLQTVGDEEFEYRYLRHIPREGGTVRLESVQPGLCRCSISKVRVYDMLGLIWLPVRAPKQTQTAVLPLPEEPKPLPDLTAFRAVRLTALPQGTFSEDHDHRPYREGDNVRSIHWKLSQKTDELIVREPVAPEHLRTFVILTPAKTLQELQSELGQLRWLSNWLAERGLAHKVLFMADGTMVTKEILKQEDVTPMLAEACASTVFGENPPKLASPEADWCYRILPRQEAAS